MKILHWILIFSRFISDSSVRLGYLTKLGLMDKVSDEKYLCKKYKNIYKRNLNLTNPSTFNEKLQWLKLYDRRPEYTVMVDKYLVREYVSDKIGAEYLVPQLGIWDEPEEIDFSALPDQFVLKCNHNSGLGMYICRDKSQLNISQVKKELRKGLKQDYYFTGREWPYKNVPRKIIAEQFLQSDVGGLTDYKVHCFNGKPRFVLVCKDRFADTGLTEDFFSEKWEHLNICRPNHPNATQTIKKPDKLPQLLELAKKLADGIPFLRVDFYIVDCKIYFSELTFFPASGFERFEPEEWDKTFGDWLVLPSKTQEDKS